MGVRGRGREPDLVLCGNKALLMSENAEACDDELELELESVGGGSLRNAQRHTGGPGVIMKERKPKAREED